MIEAHSKAFHLLGLGRVSLAQLFLLFLGLKRQILVGQTHAGIRFVALFFRLGFRFGNLECKFIFHIRNLFHYFSIIFHLLRIFAGQPNWHAAPDRQSSSSPWSHRDRRPSWRQPRYVCFVFSEHRSWISLRSAADHRQSWESRRSVLPLGLPQFSAGEQPKID